MTALCFLRERHHATRPHGLLILSHANAACIDAHPFDGRPTIMVRITSERAFHPLECSDFFDAIVECHFEDIDPTPAALAERPDFAAMAMQPDDARRIATLFRAYPEHCLVVHCDAGISRSAAVGSVWARWRADSELDSLIHSRRFWMPNAHVMSLLSRELGVVPVAAAPDSREEP